MPIIDLQRRLVEVGRLRMGEKVSDTGRPARLEKWRLTSRNEQCLDAAAALFGGKVRPWEQRPGEYELYTETDALPILLLPGQTLSSWYEMWSGGGCQRRCDGVTEQLTDGPCLCDPENRECKPHTRLNVLLKDVPGVGCWRLDTSGFYAAVELAGTVELLEMATAKGVLLPARLRIDQRTSLRDGQTRKFPVPTLDIDVKPLEMHAIARSTAGEAAAAQGPALAYQPVAAIGPPPSVSLSEGLAAANGQTERREHTRSSAPIGESAEFEFNEPVPVPEDSPTVGDSPSVAVGEVASAEQQKLLMATAREAGLSDARRYEITASICGEGIRSVKRAPKDKVDELLAAFTSPATLGVGELLGKVQDYGNSLGIIDQVNLSCEQYAVNHSEDELRAWLEHQLARLKERYEAQA